ncbi:MAG: CocE/NonD family hydrolase [Opitutaceae bacterium]
MSDGARLCTDTYLPEGTGPWPAVLIRTPYGRGHVDQVKPEVWMKDGWALVVQDTRGRGASEGANLAFEGDGWAANHDGSDTIRWIAAQPWCDGHLATFGASALGIAQLLTDGTGARPVSAQYICVATPSLFSGIYRQGVFRKTLVEEWLKICRYEPGTLREWTSHRTYDRYWALRDLAGHYPLADAPAVHEGGWFDIFTQGTIDSFTGLNESGGPHARGRQHLIMGPWTHAVQIDHAGQLVFPGGAAIPSEAGRPLEWLDREVKGAHGGPGSEPPVTYYVMGDTTDGQAPGNFWRKSDRWPRPDAVPTALYLCADHSAGFQAPTSRNGSLSFDSDPAKPVPTVGGPQLPGTSLAAGPWDQAEVERRPDVLVFTSEPLAAPTEVTGRLAADLWVTSDAPDTDFIVRLCIVGADGKSYNLAEGAIRARYRQSPSEEHFLEAGNAYELKVDLWSTSIVFNKGNRIRVQVASTCYPGYDVNPNNGLRLDVPSDPRVAHNTLLLSSDHPSRLTLPVAPFLPAAKYE